MHNLARNQLVWISAQAWQQMQARDWDTQAQQILAHWRGNKLPLVVCRQRSAADEVSLGLPAPQAWSRRRLALSVERDQITVRAEFPSLAQVARAQPWEEAATALDSGLSDGAVQARVYGSHGWQFLTGLPYLHPASDLDLSLQVTDFAAACRVLQTLAAAALPMRLDAEIVFVGGRAVAWRELQQLVSGQAAQVLVKDRYCVQLAHLHQVRAFAAGAAEPVPG